MTARPPAQQPGGPVPLLRESVHVLLDNWHGHATVPAQGLYPHQWSWDSAFVALGLRHGAPRRAATELLSLFGAQWADGRIPHIAFNPAVHPDAYFPGPAFWRSSERNGHPPVDTSGLVQPPVHAVAALAVTDGLGDRGPAFARRAYPALVAQHAYLRTRRAAGPAQLAAVVHPWETGMDNSPAWDAPLQAVPADHDLFQTYTRRDLDHAGEGERPTDDDYARYIRLALVYRDSGYDDDRVREEGEFVVVEPAFNALWAWSELALAQLADRLGGDPSPHQDEAARITAALVAELFSAEEGLFTARDQRSGRRLAERTVGGLLPLVLPGLPPAVARALVATLTGPSFRAGSPATAGVPTFDLTDPRFDAQRYWRGPSWLNTTWLVARGWKRTGTRRSPRSWTPTWCGWPQEPGCGSTSIRSPVPGTARTDSAGPRPWSWTPCSRARRPAPEPGTDTTRTPLGSGRRRAAAGVPTRLRSVPPLHTPKGVLTHARGAVGWPYRVLSGPAPERRPGRGDAALRRRRRCSDAARPARKPATRPGRGRRRRPRAGR